MPRKLFAVGGVILVLAAVSVGHGQNKDTDSAVEALQKRVANLEEQLRLADEKLSRRVDDLLLFRRLEDVADVDKGRYTGPPPRNIKNPTAPGAKNPVIIYSYSFIPKKRPANGKLPLMILVHGGIHGHLNSTQIAEIRELIQQGYAVAAPDYRGSTGYGKDFWQQIDYGGLEVEDVFADKQWMLEKFDFLDPERVGILGWSHGGLITLMNLFNHPKDFKAGYASVPVSDLVARMGYKDEGYRQLFSAPYHIGKTAGEDPAEYRRRSPAWNAEKLETPVLIHTTTNDEDVNVLEVENLIKALKAAGKKFEHKVYQDAPGGHEFNRIDTKAARESRAEAYRFLARYLSPPNPPK
ncbi:MAG: S9 family peptidase [Planctomycetes bacterium]|nr:S9 family peptidase [Planctomycetota bacterium]